VRQFTGFRENLQNIADPLWERACSGRRSDEGGVSDTTPSSERRPEQARSHRKSGLYQLLRPNRRAIALDEFCRHALGLARGQLDADERGLRAQ